MPPALSDVVIFVDRSHVFSFAQASLDCNMPPCLAGTIGVFHNNWLIGWDGVLLIFCPTWSQTMILLISAYWVAWIVGVNHAAQLVSLSFSLFHVCVHLG
jgi:hypothetical protein